IDEFDQLPSKCQQFIDDVLPTEFRSEDNDNFNGLDENIFDSVSPTIESPGLILRKNNFFSQFIKESMDITGSIHSKPSNSVTSLNKNNTTLDNTPTESSDEVTHISLAKRKKNSSTYKNKQYGNLFEAVERLGQKQKKDITDEESNKEKLKKTKKSQSKKSVKRNQTS